MNVANQIRNGTICNSPNATNEMIFLTEKVRQKMHYRSHGINDQSEKGHLS
jgi:hypothetical protein